MFLQRGLADLDPSRIKRCVLVLDRAHKHHIFEPFEARQSRQSVQARLLIQPLISHAQLRQAPRVSPLFEQPHAGVEELVRIVHVTEVRRAQADEREELGSELGQVRQSRSNDQTAHRVPNEAYLANARDGAEREDVLFDFRGQSLTHLHNVTLSVVLVALREQNNGIWVLKRDLILEQPHIVVIALEAMLHDE